MRDRFVGVLSHELRTPVTTIYGGAEVLARRGGTITEESVARSTMTFARKRIVSIAWSRICSSSAASSARACRSRPSRCSCSVLCRASSRTRPHVGRALEFVEELRSGLPPVAGERPYVEQVLRNLLGNAYKYGGGAPITIEARRPRSRSSRHHQRSRPGLSRGRAREAVRPLLQIAVTVADGERRGHRPVRVPAARPGHGRHHHGIEGPGRRSEVHVPAPPARRDRRGLGPPGLDRPGNRRAHRRFDGRRPLTGTGPGLRATLQACSDTTSGRPSSSSMSRTTSPTRPAACPSPAARPSSRSSTARSRRPRRPAPLVVFTQDWHPETTPHFAKDGGIWPVHCVGGHVGRGAPSRT